LTGDGPGRHGATRSSVTTSLPAVWQPAVGTGKEPRPAGRRADPQAAALRVWPLAVILAVESALALRLTWSNTAFNDEGLYLWAGHLEWAHLLHGDPIPNFAYYFSGDPLVYPPLGALADSFGGLAAARILSLCFMLLATCLLWASASRLYGRTAATSAAALWAILGPVQHTSSLATFDAMSICLMAVAAYSAVRAAGGRSSSSWAILSGCAIAAGNLAAYSSAIFDPVIIALAVAAIGSRTGFRLAWARAAEMVTCAVVGIVLATGGGAYLKGATLTVFNRTAATTPATEVIGESLAWTGAILVLACAAIVLSAVRAGRGELPELIVLTLAAIVVPVEQARLHTLTSLDKHVALGAWFGAVAAGYAMAKVLTFLRSGPVRVAGQATAAAAVLVLAVIGAEQATALYGWANVTAFVSALRPLAEHSSGPMLIEDPAPARYYLGSQVPWQRWSSTASIMMPIGSHHHIAGVSTSGKAGPYLRLIASGYFSVVALDYHSGSLDWQLTAAMKYSHRYRLVSQVRYGKGRYVIWVARVQGT